MAKKKSENIIDQLEPKGLRFAGLEKRNYPQFVRELHMLDVGIKEWSDLKDEITKQIRRACRETVPVLNANILAKKTKVSRNASVMWLSGETQPTLLSLFLISKATGRKLVVKLE